MKLLDAVTTTATGSAYKSAPGGIQAVVAGTGAVSASVDIEVSNDNVNWLWLATIAVTGTTTASAGTVVDRTLGMIRGRVTAISGTGAAVTVTLEP